MRHPTRTSAGAPRRGIALIAVLVVVAILALAAYRFSDLMAAEAQAGDSYTRSVQAQGAAQSGIAYFAALLANDPTGQNTGQGTLNGNLYDNPAMFQGILLHEGNEPRNRIRFSIVSALDADTLTTGGGNTGFRYGVTDEAGKININALFKLDSSGQTLYNTLMQLPNMTDDIANSIVFWVDPTATQRSSGATDEYYGSLSPPYHAKNAPLDSIEELLYVKGVTPQLLFGNDRKRNGQVDPDTDQEGGTLDLGWFPYLTMYSRELNVDSQGNPRVWVNDPNVQALQTNLTNAGLDDSLVSFIVAYRTYGPANSGSGGGANSGSNPTGNAGAKPASPAAGAKPASPAAGQGSMGSGAGAAGGAAGAMAGGGGGAAAGAAARGPLTRSALGSVQGRAGGQTISSLYALINAQVTIPAQQGGQATTYSSPMSDVSSIKQYLPQVLDRLTTSQSANLPARINVNTAPSMVLSSLSTGSTSSSTPILDSTTVQTILSKRPSFSSTDPPDPIFQTPAWLITEAGLPAATVQQLDQYITARTQVYRVQVVGHFDAGGATARVEAVIDVNAGRPRVVYYRDLTGLGKGFDLPKNN